MVVVRKKLFSGKVQAFSIMESIVAMVILLVVFCTSMMMYENVLRSGINFRNIQARSDLKKWMEETKAEKSYMDASRTEHNLLLEKKISTSADRRFLIVHIEATDESDKLVAELKELVVYSGNE